jgi:hypothetical protein
MTVPSCRRIQGDAHHRFRLIGGNQGTPIRASAKIGAGAIKRFVPMKGI